MTKINEALNKETLEDVQAVFANAIEDIKATFEGAVVEAYQKGVTHGMTLGMSVEHTKPKYKTEKRKALTGERVLIIKGEHEGSVFKVKKHSRDNRSNAIDVEELPKIEGWFHFAWCDYEVIVDEPEQTPVKELTPNQQRAELIEKAREFVEEKKTLYGGLTSRKGYDAPSDSNAVTDADFIVNIEKRAVVCLLRTQLGKQVVDKGIAKCMPDDVFNADIGKAIALARALEIDVPSEFLNSVQPNEIVIGMDLAILLESNNRPTGEIDRVVSFDSEGFPKYADGWISTRHKIINDTNAQYEVAK